MAPEQPPTYRERSASPPGAAPGSLAGAGVWWPARSIQEEPPSEFEEDCTRIRQEPEGVVLTTTLGGSVQTPMRAELR